jgi:hypothetical protein
MYILISYVVVISFNTVSLDHNIHHFDIACTPYIDIFFYIVIIFQRTYQFLLFTTKSMRLFSLFTGFDATLCSILYLKLAILFAP